MAGIKVKNPNYIPGQNEEYIELKPELTKQGVMDTLDGEFNEVFINDTGVKPLDSHTEIYVDLSGKEGYDGMVVPEAPIDTGKAYVRRNGSWEELDYDRILDGGGARGIYGGARNINCGKANIN